MIEYVHGILNEFLAKSATDKVWEGIGLIGNLLFFSRFMVQWIASERRGQSVIPVAFWYLSLAGNGVVLIYVLHLRNPVFLLAYSLNAVVYVRNLWLIHRQRRGAEMT